jgi:hypothetical protein
MKTIILINLLLVSFLVKAGEGASDGGPRAHISNNNSAFEINGRTIFFRDIRTVETIDREILLKKEFLNVLKVSKQELLKKEILNIETRSGEFLILQ